jgi:hypothetical protein
MALFLNKESVFLGFLWKYWNILIHATNCMDSISSILNALYSAFNEGGNTTTGYGAVNISRTLQLSLPIAE